MAGRGTHEGEEMSLSNRDIEEIKTAISEAWMVDAEQHRKHHEYLDRMIEREDRRAKLREKVKVQVIGWSIASGLFAVVGFLGWMGKTFYEIWINTLPGGGQ